MKRRVLKPTVEKVITAIVIFQLILLCSLADFELRALPIIVLFVAVLGFNLKILEKFGRNPLTRQRQSAII